MQIVLSVPSFAQMLAVPSLELFVAPKNSRMPMGARISDTLVLYTLIRYHCAGFLYAAGPLKVSVLLCVPRMIPSVTYSAHNTVIYMSYAEKKRNFPQLNKAL